jgi:ABC-type antimicrobial peptide transport system permease subunit
MGESVARSRFLAVLVAVFGTLALVLAVVGTYGVLSYAVEQRRHEMGVRLALGARPGDVLRLVLAQGMGWVGAGVALGVTLALLLGQVVATVLFGVSPRDPLTLAGVVLLLSATGLAACGVPALKATRADPLDTLRAE